MSSQLAGSNPFATAAEVMQQVQQNVTNPATEVRRTQALQATGVTPAVVVPASIPRPQPSDTSSPRRGAKELSKEAAAGSKTNGEQVEAAKHSHFISAVAHAGYRDKERHGFIRDPIRQTNLFNPPPKQEPKKSLLGELKDTTMGAVRDIFGLAKPTSFTPGPKASGSLFTQEEKDMLEAWGKPEGSENSPQAQQVKLAGDPLAQGLMAIRDYRAREVAARLNHEDTMYEANPDVQDAVAHYQSVLALPQFAGERMT